MAILMFFSLLLFSLISIFPSSESNGSGSQLTPGESSPETNAHDTDSQAEVQPSEIRDDSLPEDPPVKDALPSDVETTPEPDENLGNLTGDDQAGDAVGTPAEDGEGSTVEPISEDQHGESINEETTPSVDADENELSESVADTAIIKETLIEKDPKMQAKFSSIFEKPMAEAIKGRQQPQNDKYIEEFSKEIDAISKLCGKNEIFMDMKPKHRDALKKLMAILRKKKSPNDLMDLSKRLYSHPKLNIKLWLKAFLSTSMEMPDLVGLNMPNLINIIPNSFVNTEALIDMKKGRNLKDNCVYMDGRYTEQNNDKEEHKLWYFREDFLLNIRHWYWHVWYAIETETPKSRRGEIFGFFHRDMINRYAAERLSNGLKRVKSLDWKENVILEGYDPHLGDVLDPYNNKTYGPRSPNSKIDPKDLKLVLDPLNKILEDIKSHYFIKADGTKISTNLTSSVDTFGVLMEAVEHFTINRDRYDWFGLHNHAHIVIAGLSKNKNGIMGATETAPRDIIFYRWHQYVEDLFEMARADLPPYTPINGELPLSWPGFTFKNVVLTSPAPTGGKELKGNELETYFRTATYSANHDAGILNTTGLTKFCLKILDHRPFSYGFEIMSTATEKKPATIRMFMAPRFDESGKRFTMEKQRRLFFTIDVIKVTLSPGKNRISQRSQESTLTVPTVFNGDRPPTTPSCDCGWPHHLLLPKGTTAGMTYDLFVMVTDGKVDLPKNYKPKPSHCRSAYILCGKLDDEYPDARPMGYPFDRRPFSIKTNGKNAIVTNLDEYVKENPNMITVQVKIYHSSVIQKNPTQK